MHLQRIVLPGLYGLMLILICPAASLPTAGSCIDRHQCPSGYFCSNNHYCTGCYDCPAYNRAAGAECAHSILECGDCLPGYVMGSTTPIGKCQEPLRNMPEAVPDNGMPTYIWAIVSIAVLGVMGLLAFFVTVLLRNKSLSMNGTSVISVSGPSARTLTEHIPRSNGSVPSPHFVPAQFGGNTYMPVRPSSPEMDPSYEGYRQNLPKSNQEYGEERSLGCIISQKENEVNQEAIVFRPATNEMPPSYEDTVDSDAEASEDLLVQEETVESTWTAEQADKDEASGPNVSNLLNEARHTVLIRPPTYDSDSDGSPRKIPRRQLDNGRASSDGPSSIAQPIPSVNEPLSLAAIPSASTQGSNGIVLRGASRTNMEDYNRPVISEINNNSQDSSNSDTNNNNNSSSGVGSSIPIQMSNLIMNISVQQNNDIKVMTT